MNTRQFEFSAQPLTVTEYARRLADRSSGGYCAFEGWVRDHNDGLAVTRLEYQAFEALGVKEGTRILTEAFERYPIRQALCVHRIGALDIGDVAVWVGVSAAHRDEAFRACRYIIDAVKHRVPIWKKEHYVNGDSGWVNCERCASAPAHAQEDDHGHDHRHGHQHSHDH
jgi:molybdopterin synthase catalytic subunit